MSGKAARIIVQSGPAAVVVVAGEADDTFAERMRAVVVSDDPLSAFLAAVTSTGVRTAPDFLFAALEEGNMRLLVRGGLSAEIVVGASSLAAGPAAGVTTWTEHVVEAATDLVVHNGATEFRLALAPVPASVALAPETAEAVDAEDPPPPDETILGYDGDQILAPELEPAAETDPAPGGMPPDPAIADIDLGNLFETRYKGVEAAAVRDASPDIDEVADVPVAAAAPSPAREPVAPAPPAVPVPTSNVAPPLIVGVPGAPSPAGAPPVPAMGEHDGLTVAGEALAAMRQSLAGAINGDPPRSIGPGMVQAVLCPAGHASPPHTPTCLTCHTPIADRTIRSVPRPVVGRLLFDTGMVVNVDRRLLIGRKPAADPSGPVGDLPSLVPLPDPEMLLSRTQAEVRVDGWDLSIIDRRSRNGTFVVVPGQSDPLRLRPNEPYPIASGMRILFADVAACRYDAGAA